ncbi:hypothetical protein HYQ03_gp69 [Arthrobacter phage Kuleana]|uniref:Uncharacterized protein n=1 Tax=Arthrobacter phage Kuleana TaxID=2653270 RepID=A0A5Q2WEP0_9CAUD|nr:hypothetical protein HYQ03_gp69 [Arthrobacter phage Kuleana]QGH74556.1 hypothetical protein SEA_KULEANA_69 [Arthrobacter phage Kuleana]
MGKKNGPEAWHARVLGEESERLTAAVRILEWREGYVCAGGVLESDLNSDQLLIRSEGAGA